MSLFVPPRRSSVQSVRLSCLSREGECVSGRGLARVYSRVPLRWFTSPPPLVDSLLYLLSLSLLYLLSLSGDQLLRCAASLSSSLSSLGYTPHNTCVRLLSLSLCLFYRPPLRVLSWGLSVIHTPAGLLSALLRTRPGRTLFAAVLSRLSTISLSLSYLHPLAAWALSPRGLWK